MYIYIYIYIYTYVYIYIYIYTYTYTVLPLNLHAAELRDRDDPVRVVQLLSTIQETQTQTQGSEKKKILGTMCFTYAVYVLNETVSGCRFSFSALGSFPEFSIVMPGPYSMTL